MAMTEERFDMLVRRLEPRAQADPRGYRWRVVLLGLLGYGYIAGVLLLLLLLLGLVIWVSAQIGRPTYGAIQIVIALVVFFGLVVRALWVRTEPPEGLRLVSADVPRLFETAERVRRAVGAPPAHVVLLTDDFNAGVAQVPRLGIFGWPRNYLVVGLPYLQALSPAQFEAVLAHEFGHLSGAHGRTGSWIYRIRRTWYRLLESLEERGHWGAAVFTPFFRWYAPFFGAYSFVLARAQEYEADRAAARVAGADAAASSLVVATLKAALLEERFWPELYKTVEQQPDPPPLLSTMERVLARPVDPEAGREWIGAALKQHTGTVDTHPSLADRLQALGRPADLPPPADVTAAEALLGDARPALTAALDRAWAARNGEQWRGQHEHVVEAETRLREIEERAAHGPLPDDELWTLAQLTGERRGSVAALPLSEEYLSRNPDSLVAVFFVGQLRLSEGDATGIELIERAMARGSRAVGEGLQTIIRFLFEHDRADEAAPYLKRLQAYHEVLQAARAERDRLGHKDTFVPHALDNEGITPLREQLGRYRRVKRAYLVRKQVEHFPEEPVYVLGIVVRRPSAELRSSDGRVTRQMAREIEFPGECFVVVVNNVENRQLHKRVRAVPGALIYERR